MVEFGWKLDEAARESGMTTRNLRLALERPHVLAYLRQRKQVFREHISAANISVLADLRDTAGNSMVRLGAVKVLEQLEDSQSAGTGAVSRSPGVTIVITSPSAVMDHQRLIDAKPLIDHGSGVMKRVPSADTADIDR